jgi:hypothetical protein
MLSGAGFGCLGLLGFGAGSGSLWSGKIFGCDGLFGFKF